MIPLDKQAHFFSGYALSLTVALIFGAQCGALVAIGAGVAKEVYDYFHKEFHTPDVYDFLATALGGIVAAVVFTLFDKL